jgi:hypothetical protein
MFPTVETVGDRKKPRVGNKKNLRALKKKIKKT